MPWRSLPTASHRCDRTAVPTLDEVGLDLLTRMLAYQPSKRISAKAALNHPWFDDLDKSAF